MCFLQGLWVNYQPKKDGNLSKSVVLNEILEYGKQKVKDGIAKRIASVFISRALPLLFPNETELENQHYQLEKTSEETKEEKLKTIPEIPTNLREQLKKEVREEILGRKSAQDLVDLGRKARAGTKRTQTSPDLREAIKKQKVDDNSNGEENEKSPPPSSNNTTLLPAISVVSLQPSIQSFQTSNNSEESSDDVNNQKNSILQRAMSTPPSLSGSGDTIPVFSPRKLLPSQIMPIPISAPTDNNRVLREIQALRSIIGGMQKEIEQLKDVIKKSERKERNTNSDIIKMKAEISILTATLSNSFAGLYFFSFYFNFHY